MGWQSFMALLGSIKKEQRNGRNVSKGSLTYSSVSLIPFASKNMQFFEGNGINDVSKKRSIFLSAIGPKAYLLASLIAPEKPRVKKYAELKEVRTVCSINHSEDIYQVKTNPL